MLTLLDVLAHPEGDKPEPPQVEKLRYSAHLPWIGPVLGPGAHRGADVTIAGAADPKLGDALAAVLIPVLSRGGFYQPSDPAGQPVELVDVACFKWLKSDPEGRFRITAPAKLWHGKVKSVWMLLLYERSGGASHLLEKLEVPARELPQEMTEPVKARFAKPEDDDELGLIALEPLPMPDTLTFAVGSCQYPAGFLDRDVAERSYGRLANRLRDENDLAKRPSCVLLLGDQVYLDATAGLFDPTAVYDKYRQPYERLFRMKALRQVLRRIPAHMMLDDHEIEDNWEPIDRDTKNEQKLKLGRASYVDYQRIAGPDPHGDALWHHFAVNGFPFFMTDTRTDRDARTEATIDTARIIRDTQMAALQHWLTDPVNAHKPKFVASSVSLLPRHRRATCSRAGALRSDGWDGYPVSLHRLLATVVENQIEHVVFLSGDEHISFVARVEVRCMTSQKRALMHSVHSSALYAPYPFANGVDDNLQWGDKFQFALDGATYRCEVHKCFATVGDGISVLQVKHAAQGWSVDYRFLRAGDPNIEERTEFRTAR